MREVLIGPDGRELAPTAEDMAARKMNALLGRKVEPLGDKPQISGATAKTLLLLDAEGDVWHVPAADTIIEDDSAVEKAKVAEAPWSVAEWAVALRFDNPRAAVLVMVLG